MELKHKVRFLLSGAFKGMLWMVLLGALYVLFAEFIFEKNPEFWLQRFYSQPHWIYLIYLGSEIFFGLFPPELFMLWAFNKAGTLHYCLNIAFFASVSYGAGYLGFLAGRYLHRVLYFRFLERKFFSKYWPLFRKYGAFLILVAAFTPLPWSAICLIVGTTDYPMKRFLLIATSRFLRYGIFAFIIFQSHQL